MEMKRVRYHASLGYPQKRVKFCDCMESRISSVFSSKLWAHIEFPCNRAVERAVSNLFFYVVEFVQYLTLFSDYSLPVLCLRKLKGISNYYSIKH